MAHEKEIIVARTAPREPYGCISERCSVAGCHTVLFFDGRRLECQTGHVVELTRDEVFYLSTSFRYY